MRLAFMGTPDFAVPVLEALAAADHEILRVYTQPPRRAGRGKALRASPVARRAEALGIPVSSPERFDDPSVRELSALDLEAAVVVAYGQILPPEALTAPRHGCLNLHASLLPRWRGAAPIQRAIMAGDAETGVSVMQMEAGLDTGPVLAEERLTIEPGETAGTLHDRLAALGAPLLVRTLAALARGEAVARPQSETGVTYARKIEKAEARIDWARPAHALSAHIRGLSPFPGAWCEIDGERVKILMALPGPGHGTPGELRDDRGLVACGEGALRLLRLQRAGKSPADIDDFLRGFPLPRGKRLG